MKYVIGYIHIIIRLHNFGVSATSLKIICLGQVINQYQSDANDSLATKNQLAKS
jgi:hypothetical protein